MEMDSFQNIRSSTTGTTRRTNDTIQSQSIHHSSSSPPSPTSSYQSIDLASDPLQQWVVFSPHHTSNHHTIQAPEQGLELQPDRDLPSHSPITLSSMPSHDGRGHFFTSDAPLSSSSQSSNQRFSFINHPPARCSSLVSASESQSEDDDLLSIPSSISANLSASRRSSDSASDYELSNTNQFNHPLAVEKTASFLTPVVISPGTANLTQTKSAETGLPSHRSTEQGVTNRRNTKRTDSRQRNPSRASLASRIKHPASSLSPNYAPSYEPTPIPHQPSSINLLPDQPNLHPQKNHSPQMLNFLSNVAYKLLDIHPDTLCLISSSDHPQHQNSKLHSRSNQLLHENKNNNKSRLKRFMIGDGDSERIRLEENQDDDIPSPLDLSGFKPPTPSLQYYKYQASSTSLPSSSEEEVEEETEGDSIERICCTDSCETFAPKHGKQPHERRNLFRRALSDHQLDSSADRSNLDLHHLARSFSSSDDLDHHKNIIPSPNPSSIAGILFRKVWDEWTNSDM